MNIIYQCMNIIYQCIVKVKYETHKINVNTFMPNKMNLKSFFGNLNKGPTIVFLSYIHRSSNGFEKWALHQFITETKKTPLPLASIRILLSVLIGLDLSQCDHTIGG